MTPTKFHFPYTVRRSPRARHVRLSVTAEGLTVVVPQRFCVSRDLPPILESKRDWIAEALKRVEAASRSRAEEKPIPEVVELRALEETWRVEFAPLGRERLAERDDRLLLTTDFSESEALAALRRWLLARARERLPPLLAELAGWAESSGHRFAYANVAVKEQKSRWGSCSSRGSVNLNCRLLFLPPRLARHVLLHELCHLEEMNHSKAFHGLLSALDPDARENARELRRAWGFVPRWSIRD
ncbi:MAG: M48 family metallopeptidase [Synergistaceae bacterium]|nr:M48 family metallopeptidase [Synergistaceae bacterium]